jgi:hypothetical protein
MGPRLQDYETNSLLVDTILKLNICRQLRPALLSRLFHLEF